MENKVTINELPELVSVLGTESIPVDSYDTVQLKNKTFRVSIEAIKDFVESSLGLGMPVSAEEILSWNIKETIQGAQGKADAALVLAKEYTDEELVAVKAAVTTLEDLLVSGDVELDDLQEIVDFIKLNRSDLDSLTTAGIAGLDDALELKADVSALADKVDSSTLTAALELKADVTALADKVDSATLTTALADKADVKNIFEVVAEDKTITNADAGKILFVTADCTLTVSDYASLDDGFNCRIIVDAGADTVAVAFTGADSVRGDHTEILEDTTLIKTPNDGKFVFFGK